MIFELPSSYEWLVAQYIAISTNIFENKTNYKARLRTPTGWKQTNWPFRKRGGFEPDVTEGRSNHRSAGLEPGQTVPQLLSGSQHKVRSPRLGPHRVYSKYTQFCTIKEFMS